MHRRAGFAFIPLLAFCCLGVMCGQKGPLYLPEKPPPVQAAPGVQNQGGGQAPEATEQAPASDGQAPEMEDETPETESPEADADNDDGASTEDRDAL